MSDDPDIIPSPSPALSADPQPASARPGLHAPEPAAIDHTWWDRLHQTIDLESLLSSARQVRRLYRDSRDAGEWSAEIEPRLRIAEAMILEALDDDPANRVAAEYLRQIEWVTKRH